MLPPPPSSADTGMVTMICFTPDFCFTSAIWKLWFTTYTCKIKIYGHYTCTCIHVTQITSYLQRETVVLHFCIESCHLSASLSERVILWVIESKIGSRCYGWLTVSNTCVAGSNLCPPPFIHDNHHHQHIICLPLLVATDTPPIYHLWRVNTIGWIITW